MHDIDLLNENHDNEKEMYARCSVFCSPLGALQRPYIWLEIGAVWGLCKRVAGVLHGLSPSELITQEGTPALLSRIDLVRLNDVDSYLDQLRSRAQNWRQQNER